MRKVSDHLRTKSGLDNVFAKLQSRFTGVYEIHFSGKDALLPTLAHDYLTTACHFNSTRGNKIVSHSSCAFHRPSRSMHKALSLQADSTQYPLWSPPD